MNDIACKRREFDYYPTPDWCVETLLRNIDLPGGHWLEPSAGDGAIIRAVDNLRKDVFWTAYEIQENLTDSLRPICERVIHGDYLDSQVQTIPKVIIGNPPYSMAMEFIEKSLEYKPDYLVMLLRINFICSKKRADFFVNNCPDLYILSERPRFVGNKTDMHDYAWFVWNNNKLSVGCHKIIQK